MADNEYDEYIVAARRRVFKLILFVLPIGLIGGVILAAFAGVIKSVDSPAVQVTALLIGATTIIAIVLRMAMAIYLRKFALDKWLDEQLEEE